MASLFLCAYYLAIVDVSSFISAVEIFPAFIFSN